MDEQTIDQPAAPQQPVPEPQPQVEAHKESEQLKHNKFMAVVAYILFFIPLLTDSKNDPFVKFHVKQGLVLFIACLASGIIVRMPVIGWMLMGPLNIFLFILWVIGVLNALGGKQKLLPLIGKYGEKLEL
jgi:uncharacterized membrane protein